MINNLFTVVLFQILLISCYFDDKIGIKNKEKFGVTQLKSGLVKTLKDSLNNEEKEGLIFFENALVQSRDNDRILKSVKNYTKKEFNDFLGSLELSNFKKDILFPIMKILKAKKEAMIAFENYSGGLKDNFEHKLESLEEVYLNDLKYLGDFGDFNIRYLRLKQYHLENFILEAFLELKKFISSNTK